MHVVQDKIAYLEEQRDAMAETLEEERASRVAAEEALPKVVHDASEAHQVISSPGLAMVRSDPCQESPIGEDMAPGAEGEVMRWLQEDDQPPKGGPCCGLNRTSFFP